MIAHRKIVDSKCTLPDDLVLLKSVKKIFPKPKLFMAKEIKQFMVYPDNLLRYSILNDQPMHGARWKHSLLFHEKPRSKWYYRFKWLIDFCKPPLPVYIEIDYLNEMEYFEAEHKLTLLQ